MTNDQHAVAEVARTEGAGSGAFDYLSLAMFSDRPHAAGQLLRTQHAELLVDFEQLRSLADAGVDESLSLRNAMTRMAARLMLHLQLERGVVAKQMAADPRSRALSDQFERDLLPLRGALTDWLKRFPAPSVIAANLPEFRAEAEKLFRSLEERFRHEERDLFTDFERLAGAGH